MNVYKKVNSLRKGNAANGWRMEEEKKVHTYKWE
jgi:hypothetical protein